MYTSVLLLCGVILVHCSGGSSAQSFVDAYENTNDFRECGGSRLVKITPLIIKGTEAYIGSFPWQAGLYYREVTNGTEVWEQKCGGSLITDRFILTAAHCVFHTKAEDVSVALGKVYRSWNRYENGEQKRNVSKITYPDEFDRVTFYFDIALLLLDKKIELGERIMPVCTGILGDSKYFLNKKLFVAGWGRTKSEIVGSLSETLLYSDVTIMPQRTCKDFVPSQISLFGRFCTMKNNSAESVAQPGDSGGGLTVVHEGLHYITGIVSVKIKNFIDKEMTFFTNATWQTHISWIEKEIREYDSTFKWSGDEKATNHSFRSCKLPEKSANRKFCSLADGCEDCKTDDWRCFIPPGLEAERVRVVCNPGYILKNTNSGGDVATCLSGSWYPPILECTLPDNICKQQDGQLWSCKKISECPTAQADLKEGKRPEICSFLGNEPVVCCQPSVQDPLPPETAVSISTQKCLDYAKAVYLTLKNPVGDGDIVVDSCLIVEPLITSGTSARPREYPHMALIGYGSSKEDTEWLCGGSLISERFVLSAAHCADAGKKGLASWVRLGDYDILSNADDVDKYSKSIEYEIIERVKHPEYKVSSVYNDIALYKLKTDVIFNEYVRPICLQTAHTFAKTYAIGTGWGRTEWRGKRSNYLQKANLTIIGKKKCADAYKASTGSKLKLGILDATQLCAADLENGKDICQGDAGGPLQIRLKNPYCMYSQVGISSFGVRCAAGYPSVFTRVSHYVPWIESIVWP